MRKWMLLAISLLLAFSLFTFPAFAEQAQVEENVPALSEAAAEDNALALPEGADNRDTMILSGSVTAKDTFSVKAPFGGPVLDFSLRTGDKVHADDVLFSLDTTKVYAPCVGVIGGLRSQAGDSTGFVQDRYGALCYIEPESSLKIATDTSDAYDRDENRLVHMGETVYVKSTSNSKHVGLGLITSIDGKKYTVEVQSGNLELDESVSLYRNNDYSSASRIGKGETSRINPIAITGSGSVLRIAVTEGSIVKRGGLLFETVSGELEGLLEAKPEVTAQEDGVVADILVSPGQTVTRGQVMATLHVVKSMQISATVSEMDVGNIEAGQKVSIEFESLNDKLYQGTIASISAIGNTSSDETEFTVYIDFVPDDFIREGLTATVYCLTE
jgi:multidrug efflux pump subunit AcrA (membrane-fusion protein)